MFEYPNTFTDERPIPWPVRGLILLVAVLIVFSRRPDAFVNPQFWAEDGATWYADAYNRGWSQVLFSPWTGYIQLFPRLCAAAALLVPLSRAPLVCNSLAILVQILPALFFLSRRFADVAGLRTRAYLSFVYLALPNSSEINANITCAQWHLALLAFLVIVSRPARGFFRRSFDVGTIFVSALTGPFSILLAPLAFVSWWNRRHPWKLALALLLSFGAAAQLIAILGTSGKARSHATLGAATGRLLKILSGKVFLAAIVGQHDWGSMRSGWTSYLPIAAVTVILTAAALAYTLLRARLELKLFVIFGLMVLASALVFPMASLNTPQWYVLQASRSGLRYWFFPMLALVSALVWLAGSTSPAGIRLAARIVLVTMVVGIVRDWRYPALPDLHFSEYARSFESTKPGTRSRIPINPSGWSMELVRRAPRISAR